jgi:hypothetical protein
VTFQFRALSAIEADIQYRYSIAGVTARHSSGVAGRIRQLFNVSWQELRELVALESDGSYLVGTAPAPLPTTATVTGETYAEVDWPVDAIGVYGVRVQLQTGGRWYPLKRIPWAAYQDFQYASVLNAFTQQPGPIGYTARMLPDGSGATEVAGKVMITPVPRGGQYRIWYLQAWAEKTANTDTFPGHAAFIEWAILNTCIKMLSPDADSQRAYTMWDRERAKCEARIQARARRLDDGLALEPRDARGDGYDGSLYRDDL